MRHVRCARLTLRLAYGYAAEPCSASGPSIHVLDARLRNFNFNTTQLCNNVCDDDAEKHSFFRWFDPQRALVSMSCLRLNSVKQKAT